ncbi:hypothetical protein L211DRAFT_348557 [Terfezia boudieri ATCC MYA-4762]|uniref:Uncharacterized protein n=1 Tax=Terfezia boudieri ATCC MYA-4762 TaxID=1051890 RepID=A0A3N4LGT9_9PEZI|nr:hypothetical protein L211DRAFT_348557 [Terfezia boudieri ATCC MYA-4762]
MVNGETTRTWGLGRGGGGGSGTVFEQYSSHRPVSGGGRGVSRGTSRGTFRSFFLSASASFLLASIFLSSFSFLFSSSTLPFFALIVLCTLACSSTVPTPIETARRASCSLTSLSSPSRPLRAPGLTSDACLQWRSTSITARAFPKSSLANT